MIGGPTADDEAERPLLREAKLRWFDIVCIFLLLGLYTDYIIVQSAYASQYKSDGIFLTEINTIAVGVMIITLLSLVFSLVTLVRNLYRLDHKIRFYRTRVTRNYPIFMGIAIAATVLKMLNHNEHPAVALLFIVEMVVLCVFVLFEASRVNSSPRRGSYGTLELILKSDGQANEGLFKLLVIVTSLMLCGWAMFQASTFLGAIQGDQYSTASSNIVLCLFLFLTVRFRIVSFSLLVDGFELARVTHETIFCLLALSWQITSGMVYYTFTYQDGFQFENSFLRENLELDTAMLLTINALSVYHSVQGIRSLVYVSKNSNYSGPSMRYHCPSIFFRYEYVAFHALAVWCVFYNGYRMVVNPDGYETGEYGLDGPHVVVARSLMIIEIVSAVAYVTLLNFLPPVAKVNREYHANTRYAAIVMVTQLFMASKSVAEFLSYLEDTEVGSKLSILVGFGLLPEVAFRSVSFFRFVYKFTNGRRYNLFTMTKHQEELFVGAASEPAGINEITPFLSGNDFSDYSG